MNAAILLIISDIAIIVVIVATDNVVIIVVYCVVNLAVKITSVRVIWKLKGRHFVMVEAIRWVSG